MLTLLQDACDREVKAIENEFQLSADSDGCRLQACTLAAMLKRTDLSSQQLWCHFALPSHSFHKFSWGNIKSLKTDPVWFRIMNNLSITSIHVTLDAGSERRRYARNAGSIS
jgi:secreted Zn-dependent insulinase-like peptidase